MSALKQTLPNLLTASRVALIPVISFLLFVPGLSAAWTAFGLYLFAAISDFFDGWLARRWKAGSAFGRILDPIADKLLVAALLLCMVATGEIGGIDLIPALAIILRELLVSGLREYLAPLGMSLPVSKLAKWKTATQLLALGLLLLLPVPHLWNAGLVVLWVSAGLSLATGWAYLRTAFNGS
jgi:CDP-diacylglycerol--glycerol-3-phosphate 3-phosphatidyltransferase